MSVACRIITRPSPLFSCFISEVGLKGNAPKDFVYGSPWSWALHLDKRLFRFCRAFVNMRRDASFLQCIAELHPQETAGRIASDARVIFVHQPPDHRRISVKQFWLDGEVVVVDDG